MTVVIVLVVLPLTFAAVFAWDLIRSKAQLRDKFDEKLETEFSDPHPPIARAFSPADLAYILNCSDADPSKVRRCRRIRRRVMTLFLKDLRSDFCRAWFVNLRLAPLSEDPHFAGKLLKQLIRFHGNYIAVRLRVLVEGYGYRQVRFDPLAELVGQARMTAAGLIHLMQPPTPHAALP